MTRWRSSPTGRARQHVAFSDGKEEVRIVAEAMRAARRIENLAVPARPRQSAGSGSNAQRRTSDENAGVIRAAIGHVSDLYAETRLRIICSVAFLAAA